ncbi:MAG: ATP-binding protein, partial [Holophaga sp.]|nr:ATP-binding protein [Holophaga sp.]
VKGLLEGRYPTFHMEKRYLHQDGYTVMAQVDVSLVKEYTGAPLHFLAQIQDITERKRAEEQLTQSHELLTNLARLVPGVIYQYRLFPDGRSAFPYSSPGIYDIYEVTPLEVQEDATPVFGRLHPDDYQQVADLIAESARTLETFLCEFRVILPKQGLRWRLSQAHPERMADGGTLWHGIISDITPRKQAEEENRKLHAQLEQTQKMESLGSLAGGVAHDMNNVLGAILGLASANIQDHPTGSPTQKAFQTIITAAERGGKMVKGLLSFARQSPVEVRELDMNTILQEEVGLLERTTLAKVQLEMDLASELRPIRGDAGALTHAFMNLCVNAVDAMPDHGTLTLRTRNVDNGWIEVLVEDTGIGMSKEVVEKAMDPFFTTKEMGKGTGLGLSMVYRTIQAHQGQMDIQSEPGRGTKVRLRFPASEPEAKAPAPEQAPESAPSKIALNVLLVDDDALIQSSVEAILEVLGHSVAAAFTGEDALAKLEAGFQPDLVILDMNMPGLGGLGTLPRLRSLNPTVPVILATGRADQTALNLVAANPYVTLLSKPFSMKELKQLLEKMIQRA